MSMKDSWFVALMEEAMVLMAMKRVVHIDERYGALC